MCKSIPLISHIQNTVRGIELKKIILSSFAVTTIMISVAFINFEREPAMEVMGDGKYFESIEVKVPKKSLYETSKEFEEFISEQFVYFNSIVYSGKLDSPEVQIEIEKRLKIFEEYIPEEYVEEDPIVKRLISIKEKIENEEYVEAYKLLGKFNGKLYRNEIYNITITNETL